MEKSEEMARDGIVGNREIRKSQVTSRYISSTDQFIYHFPPPPPSRFICINFKTLFFRNRLDLTCPFPVHDEWVLPHGPE